jgi:hypothetical protein
VGMEKFLEIIFCSASHDIYIANTCEQPDLELEISDYFELSYCISSPRRVMSRANVFYKSSALTNDDAGSLCVLKQRRDDRESFLMCATI